MNSVNANIALHYSGSQEQQLHILKEVSFRRFENDGILRVEGKEIWNSVTYQLLDGAAVRATLVTNDKKAFSSPIDDYRIAIKYKYSYLRLAHSMEIFFNESLFASVKVIERPFTSRVYKIHFTDMGKVEIHPLTRRELKTKNAFEGYDFISQGSVICTIVNFKHPPMLYSPYTYIMEGTVYYSDLLNDRHLLSFLQIMNFHITIEFDI